MENREIRKRAFHLYRNNWKLLLTASLVVQGLSFAVLLLINSLPISQPFTSQIMKFVPTVLLYPLTLGGMLVMFQLWNSGKDNRPKVSTIFSYYRTGKGFVSTMLAGLVLLLLKQLASIVYAAVIAVANQSSILVSLVLLFAAVVICIVLSIWINGELFLYPYLYLNGNETSPVRLLKESLGRMRGNVSPWIGFWFGLGWWALLIVLVMTAMLGGINNLAGGVAAGSGARALLTGMGFLGYFVFAIFFWLIEPYWGLACVGFAKDLLPAAGKRITEAIPQKADKSLENR